MDAAQTESESMAGWSPAKKARKQREAHNRIVTNLLPPATKWVREEAARLDLRPAVMVRVLVMEALKARGFSEARLLAEFKAFEAQQALAALEAEEAAESIDA